MTSLKILGRSIILHCRRCGIALPQDTEIDAYADMATWGYTLAFRCHGLHQRIHLPGNVFQEARDEPLRIEFGQEKPITKSRIEPEPALPPAAPAPAPRRARRVIG